MARGLYVGSQIRGYTSALGTVTTEGTGTQVLTSVVYNPRHKALTYARTGSVRDTAPASVTVDPITAGITVPSSLPAGDYQIEVIADDNVAAVTSAQQDWNNRISQPGVVWYHNFDASSEVDNFRFQGGIGTAKNIALTDGNCRWVADGFAGGGCVEENIPTGGTCGSGWWRPFSPLTGSGNGRGVNDPGANGTISPKTYDPNNSNAYNWTQGLYSHPDYLDSNHDGTEFYIQCRVKYSAGRANTSNPDGKLIYIDIPNGGNQELVIKSGVNIGAPLRFNMYTNFGSRNNSFLYEPQDGGSGPYSSYQPGSAYGAATTVNCGGNSWCYPTDEWVTLLIHVIPGRNGTDGGNGVIYGNPATANTTIEVWAAKQSQISSGYVKIWGKTNYVMNFDGLNGYNVMKAAGYMNNVNAVEGWTQRFTQVIFSKSFIACPTV